MRMLGPAIYFQLLDDPCAEPVMRNHSLHRVCEDALGIRHDERLELFDHGTAGIAGVMEVGLQLMPLPLHFYLLGINDDDEVTRIRVRCECGFVLAAENVRNAACNAAESLSVGIDDKPFLLHLIFAE